MVDDTFHMFLPHDGLLHAMEFPNWFDDVYQFVSSYLVYSSLDFGMHLVHDDLMHMMRAT